MNKQGFTLVEVMIAVGIIVIIAAVAIPNALRSRNTANQAVAAKTLNTLATALEMYAISNGAYPDNEAYLITSNPPYISNPDVITGVLDGGEGTCDEPYAGYCFDYEKTASGYTYIAFPQNPRAGTKSYIVNAGGQVSEYRR